MGEGGTRPSLCLLRPPPDVGVRRAPGCALMAQKEERPCTSRRGDVLYELDCGGEGVPWRVRERLITGPQASLSLLSISR